MNFKLKDNFLLGVATASTQIEGGVVDNNWNKSYQEGLIKDNSNPAKADDHYNRYHEDTCLMKEMGLEIYRFGLEWARIMPEEGKIDEEVINHYLDEIKEIIALGIKPLLTIHHFSNPMWFEEKGAFTKKENMPYFLDYVKLVAERFSDLVSDYITINEPNIYAYNCYYFGVWYPCHHSLKEAREVLNNFSYVHIKAYEMIHKIREEKGYHDTKVAFANHVRVFDPRNKKNPWHRFGARVMERMFQGAPTLAMTRGKFRWPLKNTWKVKKGEYADFVGINYYSRSAIAGTKDIPFSPSPRNDLEWEIYPEGIIRTTKKIYDILPRPIWVTENGTCDKMDTFRCRFLYEHLEKIASSDLPFERYYHWCFLDNWEWCEGESARFGLVHVDYETQERKIKKSGEFYSLIIQNKGCTEEMYEKYVKGIKYNIK
ncbi:MAG: glycoside hydrolase family 1 protein [Bacilli bacterium]|nr:glycoside hydrolase family 1 protein [Bacilli bacterium]